MYRSHVLRRVDIPLQRLLRLYPVYLGCITRRNYVAYVQARGFQTEATAQPVVPFRKQLKDEAKKRRAAERLGPNAQKTRANSPLEKWELTVGIEIHAQLNTERKLFSSRFPRSQRNSTHADTF